ncbi:LysR family transcriptional regulator [Thaumasiovibrio sp. DFM-14]|uniref:LysR family transcriptional regulator n=1 Tax=Thaumasiovibrio sp. DFM-14 TaxID=3384792 RepID=UPI0039A38B8A
MNINQIEMLLCTLHTGSIAEAARQLGKSRTTLSSALSALEDELGVKLFHRSGNRILATTIGEAIADDCQRLVATKNDIHTKCAQHLDDVDMALRIVRDDALPERFWRTLLNKLNQRFPSTSLSIYIAPPPELEKMVEQNTVDVAYGLLPAYADAARTQQQELGKIRMMCVAHIDHPLNKLKKVHNTDLEQYTEITLAFIDKTSLTSSPSRSSNYIALTFYEHIRDAVIDNTGWSYVPWLLIQDPLRQGLLGVVKHNRAMHWQPYGELVKADNAQSMIIRWISAEIEQYLLSVSM